MLKELIARIEELAIADADARRHLEKQDSELRASKGLIEKAELLQKVLDDEIDKRRVLLGEIDMQAKAHREAIQKKDAEIQEWLMQLANARNERDAAITRADNLATCRDRWMKIAADCGRMDGEDVGEFIARLAQQSAQGVDLAVKVEELRVANIESEAALERITKERDLLLDASKSRDVHTKDAVDIAHAYGQKPYESLGGFIGRVCMEREELKAEQLRLNAKVGPLEKLYEVVKKHVDHGAIIDNRADIYDAVAETAKALSQLTA